jgi:hypothetical protein
MLDMKEEFEDTKEVVRWKKGQTSNYKMTNNDQHKSSPKSALSIIGV